MLSRIFKLGKGWVKAEIPRMKLSKVNKARLTLFNVLKTDFNQ